MDPTNEKTYKLLEVFSRKCRRFSRRLYMHIGGDENEGKQWNANPKIQAFMRKKASRTITSCKLISTNESAKFLQKERQNYDGLG
jgi:hexosaminidase